VVTGIYRPPGIAVRLRPVPTWCSQEAAAEQIEVCPAKHLALHHFQAIDVPLDRAGTPGEGHARFDGLIVLAEPARKALEGLQRTGRRAREPGIEALRLPLADEGRRDSGDTGSRRSRIRVSQGV